MVNFYTSCFWALLSPEHFRFLYLTHSAAKIIINQDKTIADLLMHRSLLDFIHPDEKRSAQIDLGKFQNTRTPAGSITSRCRLRSFKDIAFEYYGSSQVHVTHIHTFIYTAHAHTYTHAVHIDKGKQDKFLANTHMLPG
ncbi:hypothetical protein BX666DRAFT_1916121 [Dichotomocladium elegans]|nr:hypothetical protein BX666DRAFT_1916121 [Dichotomocladium elegans]